MLTSEQLKKIVKEARPLIEQQLDLTEQVAGLRDVVTAAGGDWSQLKALVKAQIQDERDDAGDGKRVRKILDKADYAQGYADMLGLAKMNEKNSFADDEDDEARRRRRFTESMEDTIALSAQAAADGLIDPEAHAETVRLSRALASKFGNAIPADEDGVVEHITQPSGNSGEFNPASLTSNSQAERRPESTEQSAGANAEERAPASSATIQPETAKPVISASDVKPAIGVAAAASEGGEDEEAVDQTNHENTAMEVAPGGNTEADPVLSASAVEVGAPNSLGSAADKSESGGVSPALSAPADPEALYAKAVELVLQEGRASPSMLQRRLVVGFNRASDLVERMEREGVVARSPAGFLDVVNHDGPTFQPEASVH